jgi:hypothetical protein
MGPAGRCAVCSTLQSVPAEDERVLQLAALLGLGKGLSWLYAERSGFIVCEWQGRLGSWGRAAISPDGDKLARYDYGPLAALFQDVSALMGR